MSYLRIVFLIFLIFPNSSLAYETARQLSFAGTGSLNPNGVDSMLLNPAVLNIDSEISFGAGYNFGDVSGDAETKAYFLWFKDSISSAFNTKKNKAVQKKMDGMSGFPVAAALSFTNFEIENKSSNEFLDYKNYNLGLSYLTLKRMSLGMSLSYFDKARGLGFKDSFTTASVGLVYWLKPKLKIGLSGIDILNTSDQKLLEEFKASRARLSAAYNFDFLQVYGDAERVLTGELEGDMNFGLGLETSVKEFLAIRFGLFKRQSLDKFDLGAGISFTGPKLQIHYGFRQNSETDTFLNSIDFSMPLW